MRTEALRLWDWTVCLTDKLLRQAYVRPPAASRRLDPAPGPPAAEGNFLPLPQWLPSQPQPADWPPHIHGPKEVYDWAKANNIDWHSLLDSPGGPCARSNAGHE